jgi:dTDP-4-dehydrorhamnose 3,5-epimerase
MDIQPTSLPGVLLIRPKKHGDHRGFFSEVFRNDLLKKYGVDRDWMQDNHSFSTSIGVVRGLHFQAPPFAQAKIVRALRGAILDVAVDIRRGSPTYGQHVAVEISAENWTQILVPEGFAHGFCTLTADTEIAYKVNAPYDAASEGGLLWNDAGISWPVNADKAVLSDRDWKWPGLRDLVSPFTFSPD